MSQSVHAAGRLIAARLSAQPIERLPADCAPAKVADAYAIQDAIVARSGGIGGWKTAPRPNGGEFLCSPIPQPFFYVNDAVLGRIDMARPEAEMEVALRLGRNLPPRDTPYSIEEAVGAVADVIPIVEILSSRFLDRAAVDPLSPLADLQSCGAVVVGTGRADWSAIEASCQLMTLRIDGEVAGEVSGGASSHHLAVALAWLANHAAARSGGLKRGHIVITGARVGPFRVQPGSRIEGIAESLGSVKCAI
jgi:2-keto-4-pentenoate hydratase